ncbi:MAG: PEGA domain-containing protein [Labilithrix sp.]|nr:PEGA domain-containing protein [Labilithrix sp.]
MGLVLRILGALVIVAMTTGTAPRIAYAQSTPTGAEAAADEAKRKGDDAMVALRYEEALEQYRAAYEASKNPAILYNMGRAYEGLADFPKALDALEEFVDKAPPALKARVPKLDELVRDVRSRVSTLVVSAPVDDAEIRLGERVVARTKTGQVIVRVNAGKQRLVVSKDGFFPYEKDVTLPGSKIETVDAVLVPRASSGLLRVTSPVAGAAVSLDGKPLGIVPAESAVTPGSHKISLSRDGYESAETSAVLAAGEKKVVDVPMAERASILSRWWFWTAVGVAVAGGVATVFALTTEQSPDTGSIPPGRVKAELRF